VHPSREIVLIGGRADERAVVEGLLRLGHYRAERAGDWEALARRIRRRPDVPVVVLLTSADGGASALAARLQDLGHTGPFVGILRPRDSPAPPRVAPYPPGTTDGLDPRVLMPPITATELLQALDLPDAERRSRRRALPFRRSRRG
jgi:hypothetical protein